MDLPEITGYLDLGISEVVNLLRECGVSTFSSCEGGKGHAFSKPTVLVKPTNPYNSAVTRKDILQISSVLSSAGYSGYYIKQVDAYQSQSYAWQPRQQSFIEVEFWQDAPVVSRKLAG